MSENEAHSFDLPRRLGPYWLERTLGRGAMGVVYQARHLDSREIVALKTLQEPDAVLQGSLRREILALRRMDHPGIVGIVASGQDEGLPWYAMDLIEGDSLDRYGVAEMGPKRVWALDAFKDRLRVLIRLCNTLAFVHGEGIVHRDLKPTNVIVGDDGEPVLVDFGLIARYGGTANREPLEVGGKVVGTFDYMSPEQASGGLVDARADLYSLGCILYQMVTGEPPFSGSAWEVIQAHRTTAPSPPSERIADLPRELEELILALMKKEPRHRPPYATDVANRLAELIAERDIATAPAAQSYLYRPSFSGRADELRLLDDRLAASRQGKGSLALIHGESGVGKTRLAMEATRLAAKNRLRVVTGECIPVEGSGPGGFLAAPLHPFRPLLRAIADECIEGGVSTTRQLLGDRAQSLAAHEETLRQVPGFEVGTPPVDLPAEEARARLVEDLRETIAAFARAVPLLVVIDDLQWADEVSVAFLASLTAGNLEQLPLAVLGAFRSDEARGAVRELLAAPATYGIALGRVDAAAVDGIVADMLALSHPPPTLVQFMEEASEGNPFFVAEYLRAAVEARMLSRTPAGVWEVVPAQDGSPMTYETLPLPRALRQLLMRRTEEIGSDTRRVLKAAAVLGREFELSMVSTLAEAEGDGLLESTTELIRREIIAERDALNYRFSHDQIREIAYGQIPDSERRDLHRIAAELSEARLQVDKDPESSLATLAHHWHAAGVTDKALDYLERAGVVALRAGAPRDARDLFRRTIETDERSGRTTPPLERARWWRMLGEAHTGTGDLDHAITDTVEGLETLGKGLPKTLPGWLVRFATEALRQTLHRIRGPRDAGTGREAAREAAIAFERVSTGYYFEFKLLHGTVCSLGCINLAENAGEPSIGALSYSQLGYIAGGLRLHRLARRYFAIARSVGHDADPSAFAAGLYFHAMYQSGLGHWDESVKLASESVSLLADIENQQEFEVAQTVLTNAYYFEGRFQEADAQCQVILESARRRSNTQHTGWGLFLSGRSQLALGNVELATDRLERGYSLLVEASDVVSMVICEGLLARARLAVGRGDEAVQLADRLGARREGSIRRVVPLVQCLDGYRSAADVYWLMWRRDEAGPRSAEFRSKLRDVVGDLGYFAQLFPVAVPAAERARARLHWGEGRHAKALRSWRRSIEAAKRLRMPYDEMLARADLARTDDNPESRAEHEHEAKELAARLGCTNVDLHEGVLE